MLFVSCISFNLAHPYIPHRIKQDSGLDYSEMLFFDDERRNQFDLEKIGVLMILLDKKVGVTQDYIDKGLEAFAKRAQG